MANIRDARAWDLEVTASVQNAAIAMNTARVCPAWKNAVRNAGRLWFARALNTTG